jgi:hypothetical protein
MENAAARETVPASALRDTARDVSVSLKDGMSPAAARSSSFSQ